MTLYYDQWIKLLDQKDALKSFMLEHGKEFLSFYAKELERCFPLIDWRKPVEMVDEKNNHGLGCRICIAKQGINARQIKNLPKTMADHKKHLKESHGLD